MAADARVLGWAAYLSLYEFFSVYPPMQYVIAWIPRVLFQVAFFALVAQFLGGPDYLHFALVGTAAWAAYGAVVTFTVASLTWELRAGTIPLLIASPSTPLLVLVGRNLADLANGVISGIVGLGAAAVAFGVPVTPLGGVLAVMLFALIAATTYAFALFLGSFVLRFPEYRNVTSNLASIGITFLAGVYVPTAFLPDWAQAVASLLPVTHGLRSLREGLGATSLTDAVLAPAAVEVAIGALYFTLAQLSFAFFLRRARLRGTLDFH